MELSVTGRHLEITDALQRFTEDRVSKLKKYFEGIIDVHVTVTAQKRVHMAEVTVNANGLVVHGRADSVDTAAAVDAAVEKIEKQLLKYKERIKNHRNRTKDLREIAMREQVLYAADIEQSATAPRVVRTQQYAFSPMSLDDAVMQMDLMGQEFLVFSNSSTEQINVIYRRPDGDYGLIEPAE